MEVLQEVHAARGQFPVLWFIGWPGVFVEDVGEQVRGVRGGRKRRRK